MTTATVDRRDKAELSPTRREQLLDWLNRMQFVLYTILVLGLLGLGFLWHRMFKVVPPGFRGVMYRTVNGGTVTAYTWGEGLHVIPPWDKFYLYDLRLQEKTLDFRVLSDEGLSLGVEVVVRYRPYEEMLGHLQKDVGPDYFESLVRPEIEAHIRRTFGGRPAHEVYASMHDVLQEVGQFPLIGRTEKGMVGTISRPYLYVQELKLTQINLPKIVEDAIVEKYREEQLMLAYRYKLEREEKEADRKRTEAAGIRDFNLIAGRVSADMLRWRSIDAAVELAKSNNTKVVVLGGGSNGMVMQLNMGDTPNSPPAAETPGQATPPPPQAKKPERKPAPKETPENRPAAEVGALPPQHAEGTSPRTAQASGSSLLKGTATALAGSALNSLLHASEAKPQSASSSSPQPTSTRHAVMDSRPADRAERAAAP